MNKKTIHRVGVRTYKRYCPAAILTGLFAIGLVVAFFLFLKFNFFETHYYSTVFSFSGYDFTLLGFRKYLTESSDEYIIEFYLKSMLFVTPFELYDGDNALLIAICSMHETIELIFVILLGITALVAVFEAIFGLLWLILGKQSNPKITFTLGSTIFALFGLTIGLFYIYLIFYGEVLKALEADEEFYTSLSYQSLILLGVILALVIIIGVIYSTSFKDRIAADSKFAHHNEEIAVNDLSTPAITQSAAPETNVVTPQIAMDTSTYLQEPPLVRSLPEDITEIGDHAYAKDLSIKEARIPSGITSLGAGAFANCHNLETVVIPLSVVEIGYNCFFDTPKLKTIAYMGNRQSWSNIKRGSNWLNHSGTVVVITTDGAITVNPNH